MLSNKEVKREACPETHGVERVDFAFTKTSGFASQDCLSLTGKTTDGCSTSIDMSLSDLSSITDNEGKYKERKLQRPRVGIRYTRLNYKREKTGKGNDSCKPCIVVAAVLVITVVFILVFYLCSKPGLGSPLDEDIEDARSWYTSGAGALFSANDLLWTIGGVALSRLVSTSNMY